MKTLADDFEIWSDPGWYEAFLRGEAVMDSKMGADWWLRLGVAGSPCEDPARAVELKIWYMLRRWFPLKFDRARIYRTLSHLERERGNLLASLAYGMRSLRAVDGDPYGELPQLCALLRENGLDREADAAFAMYGPREQRLRACGELLEANRRRGMRWEPGAFERLDDRRNLECPRVSVVVSLYNAESKLSAFLRDLSQQTVAIRGEMEVVLVDSGSPSGEYGVFLRELDQLSFGVVYARTTNRETIQAAWNRGIGLARGAFLAFLGVDESVTPECYDLLAAELESDASLDWVMGSSVMTEVDAQGMFIRKIGEFDRSGFHADHVCLDHTYLSWVGALYRRDIHERFGYYDASFRGAGDTEFKLRVLPQLRVKGVNAVLGIFLNYPEERATGTPRAELEDLRGLFLHRTRAGTEYAFRNRSGEELLGMFVRAMRYRKSYARTISTDMELGLYALQELEARGELADPKRWVVPMVQMVERLRGLDRLPEVDVMQFREMLREAESAASVLERLHRESGLVSDPMYRILNDNRYEQYNGPVA